MKVDAAPSARVWVQSNNHSLQEYDDDEDERNDAATGVKYVEASSGSAFSVYCSFQPSHNEKSRTKANIVTCELSIDGHFASCSAARLDWRKHDFESLELKGVKSLKDGRVMLERFTFTNLVTNDESAKGLQSKDFSALGEIKAKLIFMRETGVEAVYNERDSHLRSEDGIPEKCLKGRAVSNRTSLGAPEELEMDPSLLRRMTVDYPYGKDPFATYIFKYRSHRDLQIEDIIPRSPLRLEESDNDDPESNNADSDSDLEDLTREQLKEQLRRQRRDNRAQKASDVKIKREKRDHDSMDNVEDDDEPTIVKSGSKRRRTARDSDVEVIDLCGDDD